MKITKRIKCITLTMLALLGILFAGTASATHKLQIYNYTTFPLKVKWYCKGKHKDSDAMIWPGHDTKGLANKRCKNVGDLTFKLEYDWTVNGSRVGAKLGKKFGYGQWYLFPHYNLWGDMYPGTTAGVIFRETKFRALQNYSKQVLGKDRACVMVTLDPVATAKGLPAPIAVPCVK